MCFKDWTFFNFIKDEIMTKKIFLIVALLAFNFQITSCTSKKSQDEAAVVANSDVDKIEAEDNFVTNTDADAAPAATADPSLQAALGEAPAPIDSGSAEPGSNDLKLDSTTSTNPDAAVANVAAAPTLDESSLSDIPDQANNAATAPGTETPAPQNLTELTAPAPAPQETVIATEPAPTVAESAPPMAEPAPFIENSGTNMAMTETAPAPAKIKSSGGGLKKIASTIPYKAGSGWVNTVYVARPGETLKDISQKIFAADKSKDLKRITENSYLKSRAVKAGDKVYYVSPNRPDDSAKTLLYYEDMGMVPEMYVAKKGDNLRKIGKQILGYDKGYVELWTSNPVESKAKLNEGDTLRYWRSASGVMTTAQNNQSDRPTLIDPPQAPPQNVAANTAPPQPAPQPEMQMPPPPTDNAATLPPPPNPSAATTAPPQPAPQPEMQMPPPPTETAAALPPPPPPPPPAEVAPPPPVDELAAAAAPGAAKKKKNVAEEEAATGIGGLDNDTLMSLGAVGVLTAALAFVLIRRKKKKAAEQAAAMSSEMNIG